MHAAFDETKKEIAHLLRLLLLHPVTGALDVMELTRDAKQRFTLLLHTRLAYA